MQYDPQTLAAALPAYDIHQPGVVTSTQQVARDLVDAQQAEFKTPALIVAEHQTQGRGRGSNRWLADEGSIAATFVLDAPQKPSPLELPLRTGLAVREALAQWLDPSQIQIKWPNDVWVAGKKIAGVLCERRHHKDLIGVGLNVNVDITSLATGDATVAERATSLHMHLPANAAAPSRQDVLVAIAHHIARLWQQHDWCDALNAVHALTGNDITVITPDGPIAGVCEGIDEEGCLILRTGQRVHHLLDGTIQK